MSFYQLPTIASCLHWRR